MQEIQSLQNKQTDQKDTYFIVNTIFLVLQAGLLVAAVVWDIIQYRYEMTLFTFFLLDVLLVQMFFPECYGILIGILSYKTKYKNAVIWFDCLGLAFSLLLLGWMGFFALMGGVEGIAFPAPIYVAVISVVVLFIRTIVDVQIALTIKYKKRREKKF